MFLSHTDIFLPLSPPLSLSLSLPSSLSKNNEKLSFGEVKRKSIKSHCSRMAWGRGNMHE